MSRILYRGPDRHTPRSRTAWQEQNAGSFEEGKTLAEYLIDALGCTFLIGVCVFAVAAFI